ncbi:MAG: thioredoxin family protein [Anaerolineae bacterium]|nr:thioredoxin family protein [Anaerolineae bacterium]
MGMLKDSDKAKVREFFANIEQPVKMVMFTQEIECEYCTMTRELLEELAGLSDKLSLEVYDFVKDEVLAKQYAVDKIPATLLLGDKDYGIRFYGVPAGYEFMTLIEDILDVGKRDPGLPDAIVQALAKVDKPVRMQAMISPTCPYCPQAVRTAHRFAMVSDFITGDMVEVTEFPHLAMKYNVQGVPNTIINETHSLVGGQPEREFLKVVLQSIGK